MQTKCVAIWQQAQRRRHMNEGLFSSCINGVSGLAKLWDSPTGSGQNEAPQFCITESTRKDASPGGLWVGGGWVTFGPGPFSSGSGGNPHQESWGPPLPPHLLSLWICSRIHLCWIFFPPSAKQSEPWGREAYSCGTCISWERIVQGSNPNSVLGTLSVSKQATWASHSLLIKWGPQIVRALPVFILALGLAFAICYVKLG